MAMISAFILCLLFGFSAVLAIAPGDEHSLCRALGSPPSVGGRVELLNSYNYINLITGFFPPPAWTQTNLDRNGVGWTEDNGEGLCRHHVRVCDYLTGSLQNNWLFTQYIRFIDAREVFVNISYNFAECQLHSSCSQTPVELYVQHGSIPNPQHRTDISRYHLVGELQQSTHSQGEQHAMFSVSRVSQTNQGFYLGLRDTGSCGVVRQITVYYRVCESRFNGPGLEFYPTLPLPPQNASEAIVANAFCAPDTVNFTAPGYLAYPNGTCVYGATCKCKPGFEKIVLGQQTSTTARCQACAEGSYRSESDTSCQQCPANTITSDRAVAVCPCANGYYRTNEEGPSTSCTAPPSDCYSIQMMDSMTTNTSLTVQWTRPQNIGRDDFYYNIHYKLSSGAAGGDDSGEYIQHNAVPYKDDSTKVVYTLSDLISYTSYQVRVTVHNGVSDQHTEQSMCETNATTSIGPPLAVREYCRLIVWKTPSNSRGQVTGYEIEFSNRLLSTVTVSMKGSRDEYHVLQDDTYRFREFRIRAIVPFAGGEWSESSKLCESQCQDNGPTNNNQHIIHTSDYVDGIICAKNHGNFTCVCSTGFTGDGLASGTRCTDINECPESCREGYLCVNLPGSFTCQDIDECTDGIAECRDGTECVNTPGGFRCDDINECTMGTDGCVTATCVNTVGSFTCICPSGFTGDGRDSGNGCTDINECTVNNANCKPGTVCVNTPGGFRCDAEDCPCTSDINECAMGTADCVDVATCVNNHGSFTCTCPSGFTGDGKASGSGCKDIYDYETQCTVHVETAYCVNEATFINTDGSFTCTCPPGFTGDGRISGTGCTEKPARHRRQVDPDELVECFVDQDCFTDATPLLVTRRECCVGNPAGAGYRIEGNEACNVCVVFGFFQTTFTAFEQGQGYSIPVGYLKRPETGVVALPFTVSEELLGTTTMADFTLHTALVAVLPSQDSRDVTFTFLVDGIAQEFDETVRLKLSVSQATLSRLPGELDNSLYFLDTADLVILDSDTLYIGFTSEDYRSTEPELSLPVRVTKNQRIATPVTVRVTSSTLTRYRLTGRSDPPGTLEDDPDSPIEADLNDFDSTPVVVTFQPDETGKRINDIDTPIGIVDDDITEAYEQNFVVTVEIICAVDTSRITIRREDALCRVIDDDDVSIGFQYTSYNFDEPPLAGDEIDIIGEVLLEKENGVVTEQTFSILVTVTPTTPNQAIRPAERSTDLADNDYTIGPNNFVIFRMDPEDQTIAFDFRLFGDDIAERTEAFQVTSTRVEDTPEFLSPVTLSPSTFIIIGDYDVIIIGFERNFTIIESVGTLDVCVVVTFPQPTVPIVIDIILSVNTIPGTADEMDYGRIAESDGVVFLQFNNMDRRLCFNLQIINDDELEDTESLTIDLVFSSFFPASSSVILDPDVTTVTILDNDEVIIGFIDAPYEANENDGTVVLTVGVLSGTLQTEIILSLLTSDGSARSGSDYQQVSGMLLTFGPDVTTRNVPVTIINDDVFEIRESFSGMLILEDGPADRVIVDPAQADVFILDDDELVFEFDPEMYSVSEDIGDAILNINFVSGDVGVFVAEVFASSLNGPAFGGSAGASGIDFISFENKFATFSSVTSRADTISVSIVNDDINEEDEQFSAILDNVVLYFGGAEVRLTDQDRDRIILDPRMADVIIVDEDEVVIGFLETEYQVGEADGNVTFLIGVRSGELSFDVDVTFQTADDTAIDGDDYSSRTETLVFTGTETQQVSVNNIINDDILEATERFLGELSGILPPRVRLDPVLASVTITDDDPVVIGFVPDSYTVDEGDGEVIFNVSVISGTLDKEVVVVFSTQDGTAQAPPDYSNTTQLLAFSSSVTSILVSVPIQDDDILENIERFSGRLDYNNPDDQSQVTLSPDTATVDIIDNDRVRIGFNPVIYNVFEENNRFVDITVEVLEGELARDVSVQFDTADDSAFSVLDYMAVLGRVLTFNADTTSQVVRVGIVDDNAVEPREYFNGTLTLLSTDATGVTVDPDMARISIEDNENVVIGFITDSYTVAEGDGRVIITVSVISGTLDREIVVVFSTQDRIAQAPSDYNNTTQLLAFSSSVTSIQVSVPIQNDDVLENIEQFLGLLDYSNPDDQSQVILSPATAIVDITE